MLVVVRVLIVGLSVVIIVITLCVVIVFNLSIIVVVVAIFVRSLCMVIVFNLSIVVVVDRLNDSRLGVLAFGLKHNKVIRDHLCVSLLK